MSQSTTSITQRDNFISYSRKELTFVNWLAGQLKRADVSFWLDFHQIQVGYAWRDQIMGAIAQSNQFLLVVSEDSITRPVVQAEWDEAFKHGKRVILLMFEGI